MIKITRHGQSGTHLQSFDYAAKRGLLGKIVLPLTRHLRAANAEKYMKPAQRHLDIGCGDGYLLKRSKSEERFGLDTLLGDEVHHHLDFPDSYFDYVTMLAVIEHMASPAELLTEIGRVLRPEGRLVITTPREAAETLIRLYAKNINQEHERYYDHQRLEAMTKSVFDIIAHHTFCFGLNQAFCLKTKDRHESPIAHIGP